MPRRHDDASRSSGTAHRPRRAGARPEPPRAGSPRPAGTTRGAGRSATRPSPRPDVAAPTRRPAARRQPAGRAGGDQSRPSAPRSVGRRGPDPVGGRAGRDQRPDAQRPGRPTPHGRTCSGARAGPAGQRAAARRRPGRAGAADAPAPDRGGSPPGPRRPALADQGRRLRAGDRADHGAVPGDRRPAGRSSSSPTAPRTPRPGWQLRLQPVDLPAPRGSILDRNGAVLAGSAEARYVFADPALVKDPGGDGRRALAAARRARARSCCPSCARTRRRRHGGAVRVPGPGRAGGRWATAVSALKLAGHRGPPGRDPGGARATTWRPT